MRILALILALSLYSPPGQADPIKVTFKNNISFGADGLAGPRLDEVFSSNSAPKDLTELTVKTIEEEIKLLPPEFHSVPITIFFEVQATLRFADGFTQDTPLSVLTSMQNPLENSIRLGIYEVRNDPVSVRSILAHEMGHMLVEWASRQTGVTPTEQLLFSAWSKGIYEGVADFISSAVTRSTLIGSNTSWFHRDILKYLGSTLQQTQTDRLSLKMAESGLPSINLVPQYRAYREWLDWLKGAFQDPAVIDPYAQGDWLAGELWKRSDNGRCANLVVTQIIRMGAGGTKFDDPNQFLNTLNLTCP